MRLIDTKQCPCNKCNICYFKRPNLCPSFKRWINKAAYDVDEVINKIEERIDCSTYYIDDDDRYNFGMEFAYKDCIGIVRKGAK